MAWESMIDRPNRSRTTSSSAWGVPWSSARASSSMLSRLWDHITHNIARSWARAPLQIRHPSLRSPTRLLEGTSTSSKNTSLKSM